MRCNTTADNVTVLVSGVLRPGIRSKAFAYATKHSYGHSHSHSQHSRVVRLVEWPRCNSELAILDGKTIGQILMTCSGQSVST